MTRPDLELHPEAVAEAAAAREWYAARSERVAEAFTAELDRAMEQICDQPEAWPSYLHGTRHYSLGCFPYLVIYRVREATIQVVAVAHGRRKPGYWKSRS